VFNEQTDNVEPVCGGRSAHDRNLIVIFRSRIRAGVQEKLDDVVSAEDGSIEQQRVAFDHLRSQQALIVRDEPSQALSVARLDGFQC